MKILKFFLRKKYTSLNGFIFPIKLQKFLQHAKEIKQYFSSKSLKINFYPLSFEIDSFPSSIKTGDKYQYIKNYS